MRILIDGTCLCDSEGRSGAGIEHYTWSIVRQLFLSAPKHEFVVYVPPSLNAVGLRSLVEGCSNVSIMKSLGPHISFVTRHIILPIRFFLARPDVMFFPTGQMPLFTIGKAVVTIHDLAIYDHPEWFPEGQNFSTKTVVPKSIEKASKIIAVSAATKQRVEELFPDSVSKVQVIHEGVDAPKEMLDAMDMDSTRFPFDRDYILYLGTIEPRKNLTQAFRAFHKFLEGRPELAQTYRFMVAGKRGWKTKEIENELVRVNHAWKEIEPNGVIQFLGPVTEEEKWNLMARASCLVFPSLYEGFGLPVLEAMSVGTPVITTRCGALPEVAGDAALFVKPDDVEQMSLAITQCLLVPQGAKQMRIDGFKRAGEFTWERTAKETLKVLEEVRKRSS
ncbi:glycosyltransferase family 4 protein [Candidatus Uhrbacteria bacterium]|jgi:glycosyltransferase involved in cell wall biosynthesis|nr:glycosyltransferase family 4 protein [Candidatus Uhrbacteria bacterium]